MNQYSAVSQGHSSLAREQRIVYLPLQMGVPTRLGLTGSFPVTNQAASDGEGLLDPERKVQLKWQ